MAKKKLTLDDLPGLEENEFNAAASAAKLPSGASDGKRLLMDYMDVPCHLIVEFQNKRNSDFRPYSDEEFKALTESIRENGVLEAVTVRALDDGRYEMLAGEHRWKASMAAEKTTVPAHVLRGISDETAEEYFSVTNLLRRDSSILDRVNGWWHYYESRGFKLGAELIDTAMEIETDVGYTRRHVARYVKLHDLIPALLERLDAKGPLHLPLMAGYWLSSLSVEEQQQISDLKRPVSEKQARKLLDAAHPLDSNTITQIMDPISRKEPVLVNYAAVNRSVKNVITKELAPEYYDRASEIIQSAVSEYLAAHEEFKKKTSVQ